MDYLFDTKQPKREKIVVGNGKKWNRSRLEQYAAGYLIRRDFHVPTGLTAPGKSEPKSKKRAAMNRTPP